MTWFIKPITGKNTIVVNKDMWSDPALFINGKGSSSITDMSTDTLPFITEVQTEGGVTEVNNFLEPCLLYEIEPSYSFEDREKEMTLRFRGVESNRVYIFTNIIPSASTGISLPETKRSATTMLGVAAGSKMGVIVYDSNFNFIDPLSLSTDISEFSFPNQAQLNASNQINITENNVVTNLVTSYVKTSKDSNNFLSLSTIGNTGIKPLNTKKGETIVEVSERVKTNQTTNTINETKINNNKSITPKEATKERIKKRKERTAEQAQQDNATRDLLSKGNLQLNFSPS